MTIPPLNVFTIVIRIYMGTLILFPSKCLYQNNNIFQLFLTEPRKKCMLGIFQNTCFLNGYHCICAHQKYTLRNRFGSHFFWQWIYTESPEISGIQMHSTLFFYEKGEENSQENYMSVGRLKKTGFGRTKSMNTLTTDLN